MDVDAESGLQAPTPVELQSISLAMDRFPDGIRPNLGSVRRLAGKRTGFSGGSVFRGDSPAGPVAIRQWPPGFPIARIEQIWRLQKLLGEQGLSWIAVPWNASVAAPPPIVDGQAIELSPWMPGKPCVEGKLQPDEATAAAVALAQLHLAATRCDERVLSPWIVRSDQLPAIRPGAFGLSPGLARRSSEWTRLWNSTMRASITHAAKDGDLRELTMRSFDACGKCAAGFDRLQTMVSQRRLKLAVCLRDVHRDHVFFDGDHVTAILDFGAIGVESPLSDLARYLSSAAGFDETVWNTALDAYRSCSSLENSALELARLFAWSGLAISVLHWCEWIVLDRRRFSNFRGAIDRWKNQVELLESTNP